MGQVGYGSIINIACMAREEERRAVAVTERLGYRLRNK